MSVQTSDYRDWQVSIIDARSLVLISFMFTTIFSVTEILTSCKRPVENNSLWGSSGGSIDRGVIF